MARCEKDGCKKDGDCHKGELCVCAASGPNRCVQGNCRDANDCGGRECAGYCRTEDDTCSSNTECGRGRLCSYVNGRFECKDPPPPPPPG